LILQWLSGDFELVASEQLLTELSRTLAYPKIQALVTTAEASLFVQLLRQSATIAIDPPSAPPRSRDPGDDYLVALAESASAILVTGDRDLLALAPGLPVFSPADFVRRLDAQ
jgi:putative PIN family toxin of toxin-antitoxin system